MVEINPTRLVQRLCAPSGHLDMPFSTKSQYKLRVREDLKTAFTLDYMGSSEFQMGTIPQAVAALTEQRKKLRADVLMLDVVPSQDEIKTLKLDLEWIKERSRNPETDESVIAAQAAYDQGKEPIKAPIYIIAPQKLLAYAKEFIAKEAVEPHWLLEPSNFRQSFVGQQHYKNTLGWFELNNGLMFFKDWPMFDRTAKIFDIAHSIPNPAEAAEAPQRTPEADKRLVSGATAQIAFDR